MMGKGWTSVAIKLRYNNDILREYLGCNSTLILLCLGFGRQNCRIQLIEVDQVLSEFAPLGFILEYHEKKRVGPIINLISSGNLRTVFNNDISAHPLTVCTIFQTKPYLILWLYQESKWAGAYQDCENRTYLRSYPVLRVVA